MTRARAITLLGASLLLVLASPAAAGPRQKQPKVHEVTITGKVVVVRGLRGGEPQITDAKGKRWLMIGALQDELLRVHGHTLTVWGTPSAKKEVFPTLKVARYEIQDAGGQKPVVGRLRRVAKGSYLLVRKSDSLLIKASRSFLRKLKKRDGCKVWMVGAVQGRTLKAFMYGWLTCKQPRVIKQKKENNK